MQSFLHRKPEIVDIWFIVSSLGVQSLKPKNRNQKPEKNTNLLASARASRFVFFSGFFLFLGFITYFDLQSM